MPEVLEAEIWRRAIVPLAGRRITEIRSDPRVSPPNLAAAATGASIVGVRRHGKVVVVDTTGPSIGLHFGMTGRVVVDGVAPIDRLAYASGGDRRDWDRLWIHTSPAPVDEPAIRMSDPRRLGRVSIDPDLSVLGPDVLDDPPDGPGLAARTGRRRTSVKAVLLDQSVVAGLGNLCADEVLYWAGIAPGRRVDELAPGEWKALVTAIRRRLPIMLRRGGSTHGVLTPDRRAGPDACPRDGAPLCRTPVGGRTAVWCPEHQR